MFFRGHFLYFMYLFIYFFHFFIFLFFFRGHFLIKTREGFLLRKIRFQKQLQLLLYFRGCIILYQGLYSIVSYGSFKGNPNFQSILDWILQILHYCCRKQHKNIENWRIIEQNLVLSLRFSLFTATCASWSNGVVVKALDSQFRGPVFKTSGWLQGWLSLSSFRGR